MKTSAPLLGEPLPAELMNTIWADRDGVHDSLADPDEAIAWLAAIKDRLDLPIGGDLAGAAHTDRDRAIGDLRRLRDALRRLAADATGDDRAAAAIAAAPAVGIEAAIDVVNRAAAAAPRWSAIELAAGVPVPVTRSARRPAEAAVSQIADEAVSLLTGSGRSSLRACHGPGCVLYFVRHHPRREWCSAACGNRARVARHYRRHHGSP